MVYLSSEAQLLEHSEAHHIPWTYWQSEIFKKSATDDELSRTRGTLDEASAVRLHVNESARKALICLMCGHSGDTADALIHAASRMGCGDMSIACAAAIIGRADIIEALVSRAPPELAEAFGEGRDPYLLAGEFGHLNVLQYFDSIMTKEKRFAVRNFYDDQVFRLADINGHREVVQYLLRDPDVFKRVTGYYHGRRGELLSFLKGIITEWRQAQMSSCPVEPAEEACLLGFQFLVCLIEENKPDWNDDIRFLLGIPGIAALVQQEPCAGKTSLFSKLLTETVKYDNYDAMEILLALAPDELCIHSWYLEAKPLADVLTFFRALTRVTGPTALDLSGNSFYSDLFRNHWQTILPILLNKYLTSLKLDLGPEDKALQEEIDATFESNRNWVTLQKRPPILLDILLNSLQTSGILQPPPAPDDGAPTADSSHSASL